MPSAQVTISQLPAAGPITGTELVPVVQNGLTVHTTTSAISSSPNQTQTFITVNQEPTLPNSRALAGNNGVTVVDGGAQSTMTVELAGTALSLQQCADGLLYKLSGVVVPRVLQSGSAGVEVTNGDGVGGDPTVSLTGRVLGLEGLGGSSGLVAITLGGVTSVDILGTTNEINVANGGGPGNPTISLADNPVLPGTEGVVLPKGTTAERNAGILGEFRYNTQTNRFEAFDGSWFNFGLGDGTVTSVNVISSVAGLNTSGGPVTSSGVITLEGVPEYAVNIQGGTAHQIPYQTAPDTTGFVDAPTVANTYLKWNGTGYEWVFAPGTGTVTSVGLSLPSEFNVTGSPITGSGTLTGAWASQTANKVFASPDGSSGTPSFRSLVAADVPEAQKVTNAATFNNSGTGAASGSTFNGSSALTVSYNTIGAPSTTGSGASGTWGISISGNAATATSATSATTATTATNATNVATTATSTNTNFYIPFAASSSTGNQALGIDSGLSYNPSTQAITAGISGGTF